MEVFRVSVWNQSVVGCRTLKWQSFPGTPQGNQLFLLTLTPAAATLGVSAQIETNSTDCHDADNNPTGILPCLHFYQSAKHDVSRYVIEQCMNHYTGFMFLGTSYNSDHSLYRHDVSRYVIEQWSFIIQAWCFHVRHRTVIIHYTGTMFPGTS